MTQPPISMGVCSPSDCDIHRDAREGGSPTNMPDSPKPAKSKVFNPRLKSRAQEPDPAANRAGRSCEEPAFLHNTPKDNSLPDLSNPDLVLDPVELINKLCGLFRSCHTGLSQFTKQSLRGSSTCHVHGNIRVPLWPVPPPRWRWSGSDHLGSRRRRRRKLLVAKHRLLQLMVCAMNWETLGHPVNAPERACLGSWISPAQHDIIERLERMINHFIHMGKFNSGELGRAAEKFRDLIACLEELPQSHEGFEDLEELTLQVLTDLDPYSSHFARKVNRDPKPFGTSSTYHCGAETDVRVELPLTGSRPVVAERVKWEHKPSFDAAPFLSNPLIRAAYLDPEVLRKPASEWDHFPPGKVFCSKEELLKLTERWDSLGACTLVPAEAKNMDEAVGLFCVPKDDKFDRLIINPKVINGRMFSISDFTKSLAPGCMLGLLHLDDDEVYRFSADDLSDFYYTFRVSEARAFRNCIRHVFAAHELSHLRCFDPCTPHTHFLVALKTLAMGDSLAVEIAQQAHYNVLRYFCGAMIPGEVMRYREPCPRGDFIELLAIDDHVGVQKLKVWELPQRPPKRDTAVFKAAEKAYQRVGLIQHERKRKRDFTQGTILGCDFDGIEGRAMAPRNRILILCLISLKISSLGHCTPKLLSMIAGCWVHVLLYRRVMFALMEAVFHDGKGLPQNQVFKLTQQTRNELQLLGVLGPLAQTDLRVKYSPNIFTTDASPFGAAVCVASIGSSVTRELWRHAEQKGYHTRLQSSVSAYLDEKGLGSEVSKNFCDHFTPLPEVFDSVPSSLQEGFLFDCVEIFRGDGAWSEAHQSLGMVVHDGIDTDGRRLRIADMSDPKIVRELVSLAARKVVREWHAGVPCLSYGTLRRPQVRSKSHPFGFNPKDPFTAYHNLIAMRTCFVLTIALLTGQFISVEQPRGSRLFLLEGYRTLITLGCVISHFCFCAFGSGFQKGSKWLHNKPWLLPLESRCTCETPHFVIQGTFTKQSVEDFDRRCTPDAVTVYGRKPCPGERVSTFSGAYPKMLMSRMASGSLAAKRGVVQRIPAAVHQRSCLEVGIPPESFSNLGRVFTEYPLRPWHEDPEWVEVICDSVSFREMFRYHFKRSGHINVNETRTYKTWLKAMCKREPDCRFVGLLDSRVCIGASSKGRSSSFALSRVLQGCVSYTLGSGLYPGLMHCGSKFNRADEPSRDRPVKSPTKELPQWLLDLQMGKHFRFECVQYSTKYSKNPARWLRFLLLLAGDIEPNPGPGIQHRPTKPRGPMDLGVGFAPVTAERMAKCFDAFRFWLEEEQ